MAVDVFIAIRGEQKVTGTDCPAPPLQPTDKADVGDRSAKGVLMLVRCSHWSWKSETDICRTEPITGS
nr:hypothetical protein CFP56_22738 [Quercus suber]